MKSTVFSFQTDTKLIPPITMRNLCMRNGIFYFRRMVNGKRILKSLRTKNPLLAQYLILQIETQYIAEKPRNPLVITTNKFTKNNFTILSDLLPTQKQNKPKGQKMMNVTQNTGHPISEIWKKHVDHAFDTKNQKTADTRVETMISMLGCSTIEELDADPYKLDEMKTKLFDYEQPAGKNKGQKYTKKTIKEHFRLMRQIIVTADNEFGLTNIDKMIRKLKLTNTTASKDLAQTKKRVPFDEGDYQKLFECMVKVKNNDLSGLQSMKDECTQDDKFLIERLYTYPQQWYFAILLALYTGARANAINTLRHQDIDLTNNTIYFHINDYLVKQQDIREKQKKLKTEESERLVPIASVLLNDLGLKNYLELHEKKHGSSAFIFEEFITTKECYKDSYMNQAINKLFIYLGIKPDKDSKVLKDFHSLNSIAENKFASRRAFDTHFVLNAAHCYTAIAFVVDEHRQTTAVASALFRTCQNQVNISITIGNESFNTVQIPAVISLAESGFQHYRLQVGTGIRLCQVHRHCLATADARNVALFLVVVGKLVDCLGAVLQSPKVLETCVGARYHIGSHQVRNCREVQAAVTVRHIHAAKTCLAGSVEIDRCAAGVSYTAIGAHGAFVVNTFSVWRDDVAANLAHHVEHFVVVVHSVVEVGRRKFKLCSVRVAAFLEFDNAFHQRMIQMKLEFWCVCIKISHFCIYLLIIILSSACSILSTLAERPQWCR